MPTELPKPEDLGAYIDTMFAREAKSRAVDWANTPEGRKALKATGGELYRIATPIDPATVVGEQ